MKILIVDKVSLQIASKYEAEAPNQSRYGGPWGDPEQFAHVAVPAEMDADCVVVDAELQVSEDSEKVAAKVMDSARAMLQRAKEFGNKVIEDFTLENMALGITADGMTGAVRKATAEVISALQTGSLYDAIDEARAIPAEKKDPKYVTDARLLAAINKIEAYLGEALSEEL